MRKLLEIALGALALVSVTAPTVQAENSNAATAELHELRSRVTALEQTQGGGECNVGCNACCDPCNRSSGVVGGFEFVYLKWHNNNLSPADGATVEPIEYQESFRVWAGWQDCDGLGVRVRYWEYDHDNGRLLDTGGAGTAPFVDDVDTYTIDLEVFDSSRLGCYWDATWFAGIRYMEFTNILLTFGEGAGPNGRGFSFHGIGPTFGGEIRRAVTDRMGIFANSRVSLLYGRDRSYQFEFGTPTFLGEEPDTVHLIYEMQLGVEAKRCLATGGYAFVRGFAEAQYWTEMVDGDDAGFIGFGAAVGIYR